jgi:hypothetical protein
LTAAAEAFIDPAGREPEDPSWEPPDELDHEPARPPAPREGMNHLVIVVLDSCRYDTFMEAQPKLMSKLGTVQKRYSYASWTGPSHYNLLTGLLPHPSPKKVYASEYYKEDFLRFSERLGAEVSFAQMLPSLWFPTFLKWKLGYRTGARVSLPVLNEATGVNRDFDDYRLMPTHNDMAAMVGDLRFYVDRPCFYMLNVGETHYPYTTPGQDSDHLPHLSGVHGVVKRLEGGGIVKAEDAPAWFDDALLQRLRGMQVDAVRYLDGVMEQLYDTVPEKTWIIITADHGELFGEEGYFGHGPIQHDKVYEVPFVEGLIR